MLDIPTRLLHPGAVLPGKAYDDDAGYDLFACESAVLPGGSLLAIRTGIAVAIPTRHCWMLKSRSGLARQGFTAENFLLVDGSSTIEAGLIDSGYRGEVIVLIRSAAGNSTRTFAPGEKIAQAVLLHLPPARIVATDTLPDAQRGERGFGSSG